MSSYIITKAHLDLQKRDAFRFSAALNENRMTNSTATSVTVFLSRKHDKIEDLKNAISLLSRCGVDFYVGGTDEGMPKTTSGQDPILGAHYCASQRR